MTSPGPGKIIITGTGRAGTTLLVQLLTELGLDTGYTPETWRRDYNEHCAAGLEHDLADRSAPQIVKNPAFCETLPDLLAHGRVKVEHAIIPVRALDHATFSRIRVGGKGEIPGGLTGTREASGQKAALAENFHSLVHTLTVHDIPLTFLEFPRFARDAGYTRNKLRWLVGGIEPAVFDAAFARVARTDLIHDFSAGLPTDAGQPALQYSRVRRNRRWRRHLERTLVWAGLVGLGWTLAAWYLAR